MNFYGHSSLVKHKVEGQPHNILRELEITSQKSTLFGNLKKIFCDLLFGCFNLVLGCVSEEKKTIASSWFHRKVNFF